MEAKSRNFQEGLKVTGAASDGDLRLRVWRQVAGALRKVSDHPRIVFVDVSSPTRTGGGEIERLLFAAQRELRASEHQRIDGQPAPSAYILLTADPHHLLPDQANIARGALGEGFRIPEFKLGAQFPTLRHALEARERHRDMWHLLDSLREHHEIPSTFDGELPEYAFGDAPPRLVIGRKYLVPGPDGTEVPAILTDAVVLEPDRRAYGSYLRDDGKSVLCTNDLTEEEMAAYRRHPDTFFGVHRKRWNTGGDPLKLYDFFHYAYRDASREQLLSQLRSHADFEQIKDSPTEELLMTLCERLVYATMRRIDKSSHTGAPVREDKPSEIEGSA